MDVMQSVKTTDCLGDREKKVSIYQLNQKKAAIEGETTQGTKVNYKHKNDRQITTHKTKDAKFSDKVTCDR